MRYLWLQLLLLLVLLFLSVVVSAAAAAVINETDDDVVVFVNLNETWKTSESLYNQNVGYCALQDHIPDTNIGYVVIQNGTIVAEGYGSGYNAENQTQIFSTTKAWSTMLIGILVGQGLVTVNATLGDIFKNDTDWINVEDAETKKSISLFEILTMSSGLRTDGVFTNEQTTLTDVLNGIRFVRREQGNFNYLAANHIVARIIQRVSGGLSPKQFAIQSGTFSAMGVQESDYQWDTFGDVEGSAYGMLSNPRTMAKLGQLYLQKGMASNNVSVVDRSWVEASTTNQLQRRVTVTSVQFFRLFRLFRGYGYQWFTDLDRIENPIELQGAYAAIGFGGQYIVVFPKHNIVVAITSDFDNIGSSRFLVKIAQNLESFQEFVEECTPSGFVSRAWENLRDRAYYRRVLLYKRLEVWANNILGLFN